MFCGDLLIVCVEQEGFSGVLVIVCAEHHVYARGCAGRDQGGRG